MATKPVTTVRLSERQVALLRQEAEKLGISVGELLRRIVDRHYGED